MIDQEMLNRCYAILDESERNQWRALRTLLLAVALLVVCLFVGFTSGRDNDPPPIVVQPQPTIPAECPESKVRDDGECAEVATGRVTICECCASCGQ